MRAVSEAVVRALRAATESDPRTTVLSIDGVGAYDHISRSSMLDALRTHEPLTGLLPFAAMFYGRASCYVYYDEEGVGHEVLQGGVANKETPSCPVCTHSANLSSMPTSTRGKACSRLSTTYTKRPHPSAHSFAGRAGFLVPPGQRPGAPREDSSLERGWRGTSRPWRPCPSKRATPRAGQGTGHCRRSSSPTSCVPSRTYSASRHAPSAREAEQTAQSLRLRGFQAPSWANGANPAREEDSSLKSRRGWQRSASAAVDKRAFECFSLTLIPHPERCCCPRVAKAQVVHSPYCPPDRTSSCRAKSSESCCCAGSGSHSR